MLFQKFESARFVVVSELPGSQRGNAGFGSTGVK
jgi:dUTPase